MTELELITSERILGTVPQIGDGNLTTSMALKALGLIDTVTMLKTVARLISQLHQRMSKNEESSQAYSQKSEEIRDSLPARIAQLLLYLELRFSLRGENQFAFWKVIQEFPLLGATFAYTLINDPWLKQFKKIEVFVPDVFPKLSAHRAIELLQKELEDVGAKFVVWNKEAKQKLEGAGLPVEKVKPFLLRGMNKIILEQGGADYNNRGERVVVKSSGSGMPAALREYLLEILRKDEISFILDTPGLLYQNNGSIFRVSQQPEDQEIRLVEFYKKLGARTKVVFAYPSEMIQVVHEMKKLGNKGLQVFCFEPRGQHEVENLVWAWNQGLIRGIVSPNQKGSLTFGEDKIPVLSAEAIIGLIK